MSRSRSVSAVVLVVVALGVGIVVGATGVAPARAEGARTAVCTGAVKPDKLPAAYSGVPQQALDAQAGWMTEQIAQGRTNFTLSPAYSASMQLLVLCAW